MPWRFACSDRIMSVTPVNALSIGHGIFNLATGLWPVLHRDSFEAVTGKNVDFWLVQSTGLLIAVSGLALTVSGRHGAPSRETKIIGMGTAASLAVIDPVYTWRRRISRVYALDCALQLSLALVWALTPSAKSVRDENK